MRTLRLVLSIGVLLLLGTGYVASQANALSGDAERIVAWAQRVDTTPIVLLALVILVAACGLSLAKEKD